MFDKENSKGEVTVNSRLIPPRCYYMLGDGNLNMNKTGAQSDHEKKNDQTEVAP